MNTQNKLRLNNIKNRIVRHQPISPEDINWLIASFENSDFELERMTNKHDRLKKAINDSQNLAFDANDRVRNVCGNDKR